MKGNREGSANPYASIQDEIHDISAEMKKYGNPHIFARDENNDYLYVKDNRTYSEQRTIRIDVNKIRGMKMKESYSDHELQKIAYSLQVELWKKRNSSEVYLNSKNPVDLLSPADALEYLGYKVSCKNSLGVFENNGSLFEVAGIIDNKKNTVDISSQFDNSVQNFTLAHELGHAILHENSRLHRDKPIDGSIPRDGTECVADRFSVHFLMPSNLVTNEFKCRYKTTQFILNHETSIALHQDEDAFHDKRSLAKFLASNEAYHGNHFPSLAKHFRVSVETMAIRLEEIKLFSYLR